MIKGHLIRNLISNDSGRRNIYVIIYFFLGFLKFETISKFKIGKERKGIRKGRKKGILQLQYTPFTERNKTCPEAMVLQSMTG